MSDSRPYFGLGAMDAIIAERAYQDEKWGGPEHDDGHSPADWASVVERETYEAFEALEDLERAKRRGYNPGIPYGLARSELVQVAASCVAAIESLDRKHDDNR